MIKNKIRRYIGLFRRLENWPMYLWLKISGLPNEINFKIKDFGPIQVSRNMLGPFRENFFDDVYDRCFPKPLQRTNPTIIDIGANVGFFSLAAFSKYPDAKIHAFEPHPYCFEMLSRYQSQFSHYSLSIYNQAVSDQVATFTLYTEGVNSFSTVSATEESTALHCPIQVESTRLDTFISEAGMDMVDWLKLDCEGAEYAILYATSPLTFAKINRISLETHVHRSPGHNRLALNDFLRNMGFKTATSPAGIGTGYIWAWREDLMDSKHL